MHVELVFDWLGGRSLVGLFFGWGAADCVGFFGLGAAECVGVGFLGLGAAECM